MPTEKVSFLVRVDRDVKANLDRTARSMGLSTNGLCSRYLKVLVEMGDRFQGANLFTGAMGELIEDIANRAIERAVRQGGLDGAMLKISKREARSRKRGRS